MNELERLDRDSIARELFVTWLGKAVRAESDTAMEAHADRVARLAVYSANVLVAELAKP